MNLWVYAPKQGAETASFGDRLAVPLMRFTLFKESRKSLSKGHSKRHSRRHSTRPGGRRASFEHFSARLRREHFFCYFLPGRKCRGQIRPNKSELVAPHIPDASWTPLRQRDESRLWGGLSFWSCTLSSGPRPRPCRSRSRTSDPLVAAVAIESRMLTDAVPLTREITASTVHLCSCMSVGSSWWL